MTITPVRCCFLVTFQLLSLNVNLGEAPKQHESGQRDECTNQKGSTLPVRARLRPFVPKDIKTVIPFNYAGGRRSTFSLRQLLSTVAGDPRVVF